MSLTGQDVLRYEKSGRLVTITLNRPQVMNAIDSRMNQALSMAWKRFADDGDAWVAIVVGAGDRAFSTGADLKEMAGRAAPGAAELWSSTPPVSGIRGESGLLKPVIAAIDGYCIAGGFELALACDLRVATTRSSFGLAEVTRGIIPAAGGTQRLIRAVPQAIALEMLMTGCTITADEARQWGLLNRVVEPGTHLRAAQDIAERLLQAAPLAVRAVKEAALRGAEMTVGDGMRLELMLYRALCESEDAVEGPAAFAAKRPAVFLGR